MSLSCNPQVRSRLNKAQRLLNLGHTPEAGRKLSEQLCCKHPGLTKAWLLLASVYGPQGRYPDVVDCCDRVLDVNPENAVAHSLLGSAMACLGQHEESIHHSTTAHSQAPSNPDILLNLCSALHALDRHEEAIGNFQVVLAVHPDHPLANFGTGNCRFDLGQWKEAIKSYHRTYRAMPDSYDINMNHGKAYARY